MDEHNTDFNQPNESGQPNGPETDENASSSAAPEPDEHPKAPAGREMLTQLQQMIDNVSYQAGPVMREVAAKAAELAAVAGAKAGPLARKAADATDQFGQRVATRSKTIADDLRRKNDFADSSADESEDGGSEENS